MKGGAAVSSTKKIDYRHWIFIGLCILTVALLFFRYWYSFERLLASFVDLWDSIKIWFVNLFSDVVEGFGWTIRIDQRLLQMPNERWQEVVTFDFEAFFYKLSVFGKEFWKSEHFQSFMVLLAEKLFKWSRILLLLLPLLYLMKWVIRLFVFSPNKRSASYDTFSVKLGKWFVKWLALPVWSFLCSMWEFLRSKKRKAYRRILTLLWLMNLNVITMLVEAIAFYFYFLGVFFLNPVSFFDPALGELFLKGVIDVLVMFDGLPFVGWLCIGWILFDKYRQSVGMDLLRHNEAKNCGFAKGLSIVSLIVGMMGSKKTTMLADLLLTFVTVFRRMFLEKMFRQDLLFPMFPIQRFEEELQKRIEEHKVFNVPSVDVWVDELKDAGELFGYDPTFGLEKETELTVISIYDMLKTYGKAYFGYITTQYIIANFSVRTDDILKNEHHCFPLWDMDFFKRRAKDQDRDGRYSHILNQDILRFGETVAKDPRNAASFGIGLYAHTEVGKSRGNQLTLEGVKKDSEEANQKNDLYSYSPKMARHAETMIDFDPMIRFLFDEQRPESVPADLRDILTVITIRECSELQLMMPFFTFENMLYDAIYLPAMNLYYKIRSYRKDNFALISLLRLGIFCLSGHYKRYYDRFGSYVLTVQSESGRNYGNAPSGEVAVTHSYYLATKKIYSNRFSTDCYDEFFKKRQLDTGKGINDIPTYQGLRMTNEEMRSQNDYFIMDLFKVFQEKKQEDSFADAVKDLLDKYSNIEDLEKDTKESSENKEFNPFEF